MASSDTHARGARRETVAAYLAPETAARMTSAARAFIGSMSVKQQPVLNPGFADFDLQSSRRYWTYLPDLDRPGLALRDLSDA